MKLATILFTLFTLSSIIMRHDVSNQAYVNYGRRPEFQSFAYFKDGGGALIAPIWVLTARHVAGGLALEDTVWIGAHFALIDDIVLHPALQPDTPDLALVKLDRSIVSVTPAKILRDAPTRDVTIHLVGRGDRGTGLTGPEEWDKVVRGATNLIDEVTAGHIVFQFDGPDSNRSTELEGISGPGDSGGPAYILDESGTWLAGISSAQDHRDQGKAGVYGVTEYYVNVAGSSKWIDETLKGNRYVVFYEKDDRFTAVLRDGEMISLRKNEVPLQPEEFAAFEESALAQLDEARLVEPAAEAGERVPMFIDYIQQLAHEAGITESVQPVNFSITETELQIEDVMVSDEYFEKALTRYRELFGQALKGGFNFKLD